MEEKVFELENLNKEEDERNKEILKKYPKYLPVGSVVMLKNGLKRVMITGYLPVVETEETKEYDYIACLYPEGILKTDYNICFNHEDIKKIYAIGLRDEEQKDFEKNMKEAIDLKNKLETE